MAKYSYKAIRSGGEKYEGELEATNKFMLYELVRKEGGTVLHAEEAKSKAKKSFDLSIFKLHSGVKMTEKIQFAKNLGVMIDAGLPLTRAISVMERQSKSPAFKEVMGNINASIGRGDSLSAALERYPKVFSNLFVSMTRAGEESGSLTASLRSVGNQMEKAHLLTKKIRGAMLYPAVILGVMAAIMALMLVYVVPTLSSVFKELNVELPLSTRFIIGFSNFLKDHFLIAVLIVTAIVGGIVYWCKTKQGKRVLDATILKLPVIGEIARHANSARTARTLTSLLSAGVDILVALKISGDVVQNSYYKEVLKKAEMAVEKGKPISAVFIAEEKLYPAFVGEMTSIGEETGKLGEMCENIAVYYENEVDQKTKDLSTIIEPFLMVFIGVAVGFFAVSMLMPMYSLVDAI